MLLKKYLKIVTEALCLGNNIIKRKKVETILFKCLKRVIEKRNYDTKEEMAEKITIIYANGQLTSAQYEELMDLLEEA